MTAGSGGSCSRRYMWIGSVAMLCSCATVGASSSGGPAPVAQHEDAAQRQAFIAKVQHQFPSGLYLVGYGVGTTAQQAEDDARVRAAANISSEIKANLQSLQSEQTVDGKTSNGVTVSEEVVQRVQTDAGAFIRVRPELTTLIGDTYEAVAVANRHELDGKYERDAEKIMQKLLVAWDSAQKEQSGPIQAVTSALCEARGFESKLDSLDRERWLVAGHGVWTDQAKARRQQIEELRARLKSTKVSVIRTPEVPGVDEALFKALSSAGLAVDLVEKPDCAAGGLVVAVAKNENCSSTMLGPRCDASLTATGNRCNANDSLFSETSNQGVAMNATDQSVAERAALMKVDVDHFVAGVAHRVARSVEGECGQ